MNIVTPSIIVEEGEAFEKDALERKGFGQSLLNLVSRTTNELVISLDGEWGEGKTTFVKMWQGLLTQEQIPNVYIDAFANDYIDDAFIAVASTINSYIEDNSTDLNENKSKEFRDKAKKVGVQLLSWGAKVSIKAATLGVIKDSDINEIKDIKNDLANGVSKVAGDFIGDFVGDRLASHKQDVELLQSFKKSLSEISTLLSPEGGKPFVIIIDELDRCKPTYAVEMIEKVKHLFSTKNVIFVLVMHKKQLQESVKCVYGKDIDAHTYLQKFINIETAIPKKIGKRNNDIDNYNKKLFNLHEIEMRQDREELVNFLGIFAKHFNLSLRELEKVYTNIAVFYSSLTKHEAEGDNDKTWLIAFLAVIKVVRPLEYENISHQRVFWEDINKQIKLPEVQGTNELGIAIDYLKCLFITNEQCKELYCNTGTYHEMICYQMNMARKDIISFHVKKLNMFTVADRNG